jgi:very-short-patch-repair endonuclease
MTNQYLNGWKQEEINYLKENYGILFGKDIAKKLNRTYRAIRSKAEKLGLYAPLSDFKNNNPTKLPIIIEKIRKYQKARWKDKNSILNSKKYRKKQSKSLKKKWQNQEYLEKMNFRDKNCKNKGKVRTKKMREHYSKIHKKLWKDPNSKYQSKRYKLELKKRVKEMMRAQHRKPNKPEKKVIEIIEKHKLPFNYVGNGQVWFKGYDTLFNPDFLSKIPKYIIEVFGDYWHNLIFYKKRDKKRLLTYSKYGYKTLVIWEHELENPQRVTEKIVEFISH